MLLMKPGGNLVERPVRPAALLDRYPAAIERVFRPERCPSPATDPA